MEMVAELNKELIMVFLPPFSALLFALGGTQISVTISGKKYLRRFVLPFVFIIFCLCASVNVIQSILVGSLAIGSFCLGYGENKTWIYRFFVAISYGLITIPIGISLWNIFTIITFTGFFWLSNHKSTSQIFIHKIVEVATGGLCGIQLSYLLMGNGGTWFYASA